MSDPAPGGIAVIGMSGRFPRADGIEQFWDNLCGGRECITHFTEQELLDAGVAAAQLAHPHYVRANATVDGIDLFDAAFFGFNPRDAEIMDPQHRVFMECAWEALEDAGCDPERFAGLIGVYAGTTMSTYAHLLYDNPRLVGVVDDFQLLLGNDKDHLATRIAYKFNLRGPAITLGTACSTSLVAICQGCQSLLDYQTDVVLAGGVTLGVPQRRGYLYSEGGIASPDGHCRPFDAAAKGTVGGNGAAVVVLKRLADAIAERDPVRAVILGFGLNNDGSGKVGYTAPSVDGQAEAIALALAMSGVQPASVTMLEAHGTATPLGDPIEFHALCQAYGQEAARNFCALGSVKSNVGHMDSAAGAAGLIKCVLALERGRIPPSLHFERPNPRLDLEASPFFVNTRLLDWQPDCGVRRAGVSSFGIGGTNAHAVLEQPPAARPGSRSRRFALTVLSARSERALDQAAERLADHLERHPELDLADVAWTLQTGRRQFGHRRAVVARSAVELAGMLRAPAPRSAPAVHDGRRIEVAFLFPGQGAQYPNMTRGLYECEAVFREAVDRCSQALQPMLGLDLRTLLYPEPGAEAQADALLRRTEFTQPALFTVSHALALLWMRWGVRPTAMLGHSIGEYVAACLAGVFSEADALRIVAERGRALADCPAGAMLAVTLPQAELQPLLGERLDLAAVNAPGRCVVAGAEPDIAALEARLRAAGAESGRLNTSHAFHSRLVEGAAARLQAVVADVQRQPPRIPFVSNVTGLWIDAGDAQSPAYWARHLRAPVRFADGLARLLHGADTVLLEVGPGTSLAGLARQLADRPAGRPIFSSTRHAHETVHDQQRLLQALGGLWTHGVEVDWAAFHADESRNRVRLPTYAFQRERYWIDPAPPEALAPQGVDPAAVSGRQDLENWFYVPRWVRAAPLPFAAGAAAETWLVVGPAERTAALRQVLDALGQRHVALLPAARAAVLSQDAVEAPIEDRAALAGVLGQLAAEDRFPRRIACFADAPGTAAFHAALALVQACTAVAVDRRIDLVLVTRGGQRVLDADAVDPYQGMLCGLAVTVPQEYPGLRCRLVDLEPDPAESAVLSLASEILGAHAAPRSAYRRTQRWVQTYEPAPLAAPQRGFSAAGGTFVVTGGMGRIGLLFAEHLSRCGARCVALLGRGATRPADGRIAAIEALGARVETHAVDVSDPARLAETLRAVRGRHGRIRGVVHAAGLTRRDAFGPLSALDRTACEAHFAPKVHGLEALATALAEDPPDFVCLQSSISTVLGGLGFCPYAAANAFLDGFAEARGVRGGTRWIAVNWDGWRLDADASAAQAAGAAGEHGADATAGQAPDAAVEQAPDAAVGQAGDELPLIGAADGVEALERILAADDLTQIVVSVAPLGPRLEQWVEPAQDAEAAAQAAAPAAGEHRRPALDTAFAAPATGRQAQLAAIFREMLGLDQVGANDNFFELGGHSLLAIQVISRVRALVGRDLPISTLFDHPSVAALDAALGGGADPADSQTMLRLLDRIERLDDEQVQALMRAADGEQPRIAAAPDAVGPGAAALADFVAAVETAADSRTDAHADVRTDVRADARADARIDVRADAHSDVRTDVRADASQG